MTILKNDFDDYFFKNGGHARIILHGLKRNTLKMTKLPLH